MSRSALRIASATIRCRPKKFRSPGHVPKSCSGIRHRSAAKSTGLPSGRTYVSSADGAKLSFEWRPIRGLGWVSVDAQERLLDLAEDRIGGKKLIARVGAWIGDGLEGKASF